MYYSAQLLAVAALAASAAAQSLTSALASNSNLTALTQLLSSYPDLTSALGGASNITILAPSNDAIQALMASNSSSAGSSASITALLQYHVLNGTYKSSDITSNSTFVRTLLTNSDYTKVTGGQRVEAVMAKNKVTFISGGLYNSSVTAADIQFDGGYIHVIDRVLVVPPKLSAKPSLSNAGTTVSALYNLLSTTSLLDTVSDLSDVTIFAPSDKGLNNVAGQLAALSGDQATNVAKYHVVQTQGQSPYYTPRFGTNANTTLTTLSGANLTVTEVMGNNGLKLYYVNGARIVATNWLTSGGVLHVIDNVLSPTNGSTFLSTPSIASDSGSTSVAAGGSGAAAGNSSSAHKNAAGKSVAGSAGLVGSLVVAVAAVMAAF